MHHEEADTALLAKQAHQEELRRTKEVMALIEVLAVGLFVLRKAQREAEDACNRHLVALGLEPVPYIRNTNAFGNFSGVPSLVVAVYDALLGYTRRVGIPCDCDIADPQVANFVRRQPPTLLYLEGREQLPSCDRPTWIDGESVNIDGTPSSFGPKPGEVLSLSLFDRVVRALEVER